NVVNSTPRIARGTRDEVELPRPRGTRDDVELPRPRSTRDEVALRPRGTRDDIEPMVSVHAAPPDEDTDTVVVDPEDHPSVLEDPPEEQDHLDLSGTADSIDAHMLELGKRRFGI